MTYYLHGHLSDREQHPFSGLLVQAFDDDPKSGPDLLGSAISDEKGRYHITYTKEAFTQPVESGGPDLFVRIFSPEGKLLKETERRSNASHKERIDVTDIEYVPPVKRKSDRYTISGKIVNDKGVGVAGVIVNLLEQAEPHITKSTVAVGTPVVTGADGSYSLKIKHDDLRFSHKYAPDLAVCVSDRSGKTLLTSTRYNIDAEESLNLVVDRETYAGTSEFSQINAAMLEHLSEGRRIDGLQENEKNRDLTYLSRKTKWDARLIAMNVLSHQCARTGEKGIPAGFYYSLFRSGANGGLNQLYRVSADQAVAAYKRAIKGNLVDDENADLSKIKKVFIKESVSHILDSRGGLASSTVGEMLSLSLTEEKDKTAFVEAYFHSGGTDVEEAWRAVEGKLGRDKTIPLRLAGKLGFLTFNNAPVIDQLKKRKAVKDDPVDLVRNGYYKSSAWDLIVRDEHIPNFVTGKDNVERRDKYTRWLTSQLTLSYPTAVIAEEINAGGIALKVTDSVRDEVYDVLREQRGGFELGRHSINRYLDTLEQSGINLSFKAKDALKSVHRAFQIAPSTEAMSTLIEKNLDSAFKIVRYTRDDFVSRFAKDFGSEEVAIFVHDKASMDAGLVSNMAMSYLIQSTNPLPAMMDSINGSGSGPSVKKYPTIENLLGSLDYCTCGHCESVLSPSAYLVELLQFIDLSGKEHNGVNPIERLRERRPDIEFVDLTCENTLTVLPYIDLVNEIMEYFIVHTDQNDPHNEVEQSIEGFEGYQIDEDDTSEELLASPQHVNARAYELLKCAKFPLSAPFNRNLTLSRALFEQLETDLPTALELLVKEDRFVPPAGYGWWDIFREQLGITTEEYALLTDHNSTTLQAQFGLVPGDTLNDSVANAKVFCRRTEIKYENLVELLKTRFINPDGSVLTRLELLQQVYRTALENDAALAATYGSASLFDIIHGVVNGDAGMVGDLDTLFPSDKYDTDLFGNDLKDWMHRAHSRIERLIFLVPIDPAVTCNFGNLVLQYGKANSHLRELDEMAYWKLLRFLRLKNRMDWSIEQTDQALSVFFDTTTYDIAGGDLAALDQGFVDALIKIALSARVANELKSSKKDFRKLLALWGDIDTWGRDSLYSRLLLTSAIIESADVFKADSLGEYLQADVKLLDYSSTLQAALNLTDDDWSLVIEDLSFDNTTKLHIDEISKIYRYTLLSSALKISISELIDLKELSGIDPFAAFVYKDDDDLSLASYTKPPIVRFIEIAKRVRASDFKLQDLNYLLRHYDETGKSQPKEDDIRSFAIELHMGLRKVDEEYPTGTNITEEQANSLLTAIYGAETARTIQAILSGTRVFRVAYDHTAEKLEPEIKQADQRDSLFYDNFAKELAYAGVMTKAQRTKFKAVANVADAFKDTIDKLYSVGREEFKNFLMAHPEFEEIYEDNNSFDMVAASFLTPLVTKLRKIRVHQTLTEALKADSELMDGLLHGTTDTGSGFVLLGAQGAGPVIDDFTELGSNGVSVGFHNGDDLTGAVVGAGLDVASIAYDGKMRKLPANSDDPALNISARWRFLLIAPTSENYNLEIECDDPATVVLSIDGEAAPLDQDGGMWSNKDPVLLEAGRAYAIDIQTLKIRQKAILRWQRVDNLKEVVPPSQLIPLDVYKAFRASYLRVLKAVRIAEGLKFSRNEIEYFSRDADSLIRGEGFLNTLPVAGGASNAIYGALFNVLMELLRYTEIRSRLKIEDNSLVDSLKDPTAKDEAGSLRILLFTNWDSDSLSDLIGHFTGTGGDLDAKVSELANRVVLERVVKGMGLVKETGVSASTLVKGATPDPDSDTVATLQNQVRAKYDQKDWLEVIQPVNDRLRSAQRDALVSFILARFALDPLKEHIDTANKLFEFFLIDVQMEPIMKTSRIKQAISTVQLFIYRCLMNLEEGVEPGSINAEQWAWMKRYRVWEANRKVFLYPENWLDPSLRNTKSPIFKELEGELLQSDINEDTATSSYLNYLEKLDRIAQLEICGMCREDEERIHVVGRTAGMNREYYHRLHDGTWSPWEKIALDVEDGPVIPVFWRNRLFLFWTTVVQKAQDENQLPPDKTGVSITGEMLNGPPNLKIEVSICWSEFYNGKWQPKRTSDLEDPVSFNVTGTFSRNNLALRYETLSYKDQLSVSVKYNNSLKGSFYLVNKHSRPSKSALISSTSSYEEISYDSRSFKDSAINIEYIWDNPFPSNPYPCCGMDHFLHRVVNDEFYRRLEFNHPLKNIFEEPFFALDNRHAFFVELAKGTVSLATAVNFGIETVATVKEFIEPQTWIRKDVPLPEDPLVNPPIVFHDPGVVDPSPIDDIIVARVATLATPFYFEEKPIGATGGLDLKGGKSNVI